jgi:hypothetical protein
MDGFQPAACSTAAAAAGRAIASERTATDTARVKRI